MPYGDIWSILTLWMKTFSSRGYHSQSDLLMVGSVTPSIYCWSHGVLVSAQMAFWAFTEKATCERCRLCLLVFPTMFLCIKEEVLLG